MAHHTQQSFTLDDSPIIQASRFAYPGVGTDSPHHCGSSASVNGNVLPFIHALDPCMFTTASICSDNIPYQAASRESVGFLPFYHTPYTLPEKSPNPCQGSPDLYEIQNIAIV